MRIVRLRPGNAGIEVLHVLRPRERLERRVKPPAQPTAATVAPQVDARLRRPVVGRAGVERPGVRIAEQLAVPLGRKIRITLQRVRNARGNAAVSGTSYSKMIAVSRTYGA